MLLLAILLLGSFSCFWCYETPTQRMRRLLESKIHVGLTLAELKEFLNEEKVTYWISNQGVEGYIDNVRVNLVQNGQIRLLFDFDGIGMRWKMTSFAYGP
jgi:hypothetical protein